MQLRVNERNPDKLGKLSGRKKLEPLPHLHPDFFQAPFLKGARKKGCYPTFRKGVGRCDPAIKKYFLESLSLPRFSEQKTFGDMNPNP